MFLDSKCLGCQRAAIVARNDRLKNSTSRRSPAVPQTTPTAETLGQDYENKGNNAGIRRRGARRLSAQARPGASERFHPEGRKREAAAGATAVALAHIIARRPQEPQQELGTRTSTVGDALDLAGKAFDMQQSATPRCSSHSAAEIQWAKTQKIDLAQALRLRFEGPLRTSRRRPCARVTRCTFAP